MSDGNNGESSHVCGGGRVESIWKITVPPSQFCCTEKKKKTLEKFLKGKKKGTGNNKNPTNRHTEKASWFIKL